MTSTNYSPWDLCHLQYSKHFVIKYFRIAISCWVKFPFIFLSLWNSYTLQSHFNIGKMIEVFIEKNLECSGNEIPG